MQLAPSAIAETMVMALRPGFGGATRVAVADELVVERDRALVARGREDLERLADPAVALLQVNVGRQVVEVPGVADGHLLLWLVERVPIPAATDFEQERHCAHCAEDGLLLPRQAALRLVQVADVGA